MTDRCIEYILTTHYIPISIYNSMHTYTYTIFIFIISLGKYLHIFFSQTNFLSSHHHHPHISLHIFPRCLGLPSLWDCHSATGVAAGHFDRCLGCHGGPCRGEPMSWCRAGGLDQLDVWKDFFLKLNLCTRNRQHRYHTWPCLKLESPFPDHHFLGIHTSFQMFSGVFKWSKWNIICWKVDMTYLSFLLFSMGLLTTDLEWLLPSI